jgi:hypothetical protein
MRPGAHPLAGPDSTAQCRRNPSGRDAARPHSFNAAAAGADRKVAKREVQNSKGPGSPAFNVAYGIKLALPNLPP